MKWVPAKMPARRTHAGETFLVSRYAIQIRDGSVDTTARLKTRYRLMIPDGALKKAGFALAAGHRRSQ
ncbi:hypothetical protein ACVWZ4_005944 [Bradyrhizobium sp. USDA 4472]